VFPAPSVRDQPLPGAGRDRMRRLISAMGEE
jgi:hypothetical protein